MFRRAVGEINQQGGIGYIDQRVDQHHQRVGEIGVDQLADTEVGHIEGYNPITARMANQIR